jgi:hypothetical protein
VDRADGRVLAVSDYEKRSKYLAFVSRFRSPCISSHWEFLLRPLVLHHSDEEGPVRYRQIEYHRMPLLAYLAMDDPRTLSRGDFARLVLVSGPGKKAARCPIPTSTSKVSKRASATTATGIRRPSSRAPGCSPAVTPSSWSAAPATTTSPGLENGLLGQFRHQFFLLALIPHFHKAALLMLSDRLVTALNRLRSATPNRSRIQARHPRDPRSLPALHPSLLVLRDLRPGAGAGAVQP